MATAQFALPFLQKDNEKSSSNYQISRNKFLKLLSKNGWGGGDVNCDVHKHKVFLV